MTLTEADNGKTFDIHVGEAVVLRLRENTASGYRWALEECSEEIFDIIDALYIPTDAGTRIGSDGNAEWALRSRKPGIGYVKLKLWRQWEGEASVVDRFQVLLKVGA